MLFLFSNSSINNKLLVSIVLKLILETFDITIVQRSPSNSKSYISDLKIVAPLRLKCEFLRVATHRVALRGAATQRTTQHDAERRDATRRSATRRGSWLVARGSWLVARGSWLVARGSWLVARGSWLVARGSWFVARGSWLGCDRRTDEYGPEYSESVEE